MVAPLTTNRQKYYQLMALVCEDLIANGTQAIDALVRDGHKASASKLTAVRIGRSPNVAWLIDIVRQALPKYPIPAELLPDASEAVGVGKTMALPL